MNLYEKVVALRVDIQNGGMGKSGKNSHAKFEYFELADMQPEINRLEQKHSLCSFVSFGSDTATLTIVNAEKTDEQMVVTSPMSTAKLPACHEVQNLGAVQTYLRRYLYMAAYNIVECDALDAATGADKPKPVKTPTQQKPAIAPPDEFDDHPTGEMLQDLYRLAESKGFASQSVVSGILKRFNCTPLHMSLDQYKSVLDGYATLPAKSA